MPKTVDDENLLVAAVITQAHGIKGWVKVKPFTDPEVNIFRYRNCYIDQWFDGVGNDVQLKQASRSGSKALYPVEIEQGREQGKGIVLKLKGVENRNQSEILRRANLYIEREDLEELDDDEFYWHQLEGLQVYSTQSAEGAEATPVLLGLVDHLIETGSNDVLVLKACKGSLDTKERLLPYRPEVVLEVDVESGKILVDWDPEF